MQICFIIEEIDGLTHHAHRPIVVKIIIVNTHCVLYVVLSTLHVLFHVIFMTALWGRSVIISR